MSTLAWICKKLLWVLLVVTTAFQVVAVFSIAGGNAATKYDYRPLVVATVLMVLCVVTFAVLPRGKMVPLAFAAVLGVFFVVLAVQMTRVFPVYAGADGTDHGITLWRAMYRHMSPLLLPLCMFPVWWEHHTDRLAEKAAREETPPESYFELLDSAYVMKSLPEEDTAAPRPKRSVRHRNRKSSEE